MTPIRDAAVEMMTLCLHGCAVECGRRHYDRHAYMRIVREAWERMDARRPGAQLDTLPERLVLAERVWNATFGDDERNNNGTNQ